MCESICLHVLYVSFNAYLNTKAKMQMTINTETTVRQASPFSLSVQYTLSCVGVKNETESKGEMDGGRRKEMDGKGKEKQGEEER